jgi:uncharacterized phage protein gp47/JayE
LPRKHKREKIAFQKTVGSGHNGEHDIKQNDIGVFECGIQAKSDYIDA